MSTFAIDIDSTLYDFSVPLRQAFLDLAAKHDDKDYFRGAYHPWVEWRSPADACGLDAFQEALDIVHSDEVILTRQPFDGAVDVVNRIHDEGHDILYISNRSQEAFYATHFWLDQQEFPIANHNLICTMEGKGKYIKDCQYLIDDRPRTLVEFIYDPSWHPSQQSGERSAFGLLFENNRALTDIPKVWLAPTWAGIQFYLEREGALNGSVSPAK
jgi:hypothetical protein